MKKIERRFVLLLLLCVLILAGCGETETRTPTESRGTETVVAAAPAPTSDTDYSKIKTYEVDSSCFSRVGYDREREILKVQFRDSGEYYVYFDFSADEYEAFFTRIHWGNISTHTSRENMSMNGFDKDN